MDSNDTPTPMFRIVSTCKGGGYRYARTDPPHPKRNKMGLYPLHRVLMENKLGRILDKNEVVHHIDENKSNDDIDNLMVKSNSQHARDHLSRPLMEATCAWCGKSFLIKSYIYRQRIERNSAGHVYCSLSCGTYSSSRARRSKGCSRPS